MELIQHDIQLTACCHHVLYYVCVGAAGGGGGGAPQQQDDPGIQGQAPGNVARQQAPSGFRAFVGSGNRLGGT